MSVRTPARPGVRPLSRVAWRSLGPAAVHTCRQTCRTTLCGPRTAVLTCHRASVAWRDKRTLKWTHKHKHLRTQLHKLHRCASPQAHADTARAGTAPATPPSPFHPSSPNTPHNNLTHPHLLTQAAPTPHNTLTHPHLLAQAAQTPHYILTHPHAPHPTHAASVEQHRQVRAHLLSELLGGSPALPLQLLLLLRRWWRRAVQQLRLQRLRMRLRGCQRPLLHWRVPALPGSLSASQFRRAVRCTHPCRPWCSHGWR